MGDLAELEYDFGTRGVVRRSAKLISGEDGLCSLLPSVSNGCTDKMPRVLTVCPMACQRETLMTPDISPGLIR